jgi:hypothetical protein
MFSDTKSKTSKIKGRKPLWLAIVVVIVWVSISGFTGPLFGKLSTVQENNKSSFLKSTAYCLENLPIFQLVFAIVFGNFIVSNIFFSF